MADALTTVFVPPTSCFSEYYRYEATDFYADVLGPSPTASECYPTPWSPDNATYYSPGICPSGYSTVSINLASVGDAIETQANCCPDGFSAVLDDTYHCFSAYPTNSPSITEEIVQPSSTFDQLVTPGGIWAYSIQVRFQSTDDSMLGIGTATATTTTLIVSTTTTSTTIATTQSTSILTLTPTTTTSTASVASASETLSAKHTSGLSNGAKAGIGIGVVLAVISLLAIGAFLGRSTTRRRRRRSQDGGVARPGMTYWEGRGSNI